MAVSGEGQMGGVLHSSEDAWIRAKYGTVVKSHDHKGMSVV